MYIAASFLFRLIRGAVGYQYPYTGVRYHLIIHQVVYIPELEHHLLCLVQCRANDVIVNNCPRMHCHDPDEESHSVVTVDDNAEHIVMPFFLHGVSTILNEP